MYRFFDTAACTGTMLSTAPAPSLATPTSGNTVQLFTFDGSAVPGGTTTYYLCESTNASANFYPTPVTARFHGPCIVSVNQGTDKAAVPGTIQVW